MGNDYPESVWSTEEQVAAEVTRLKKQRRKDQWMPHIHWRWYEFTLDKETNNG
jgi:hypothetical protein